ncbi:tetratricopeptide repeat protein [Flavobacterium gelidilacus]|uniref:tetratricopeptide repeat protein n=1 Tax=Flavobacterium gelidilacus TaxID=206041 RepID=UPI0004043F44|nr:tetratricopeptide repeat protein [Flavobacterium gelidilacus]
MNKVIILAILFSFKTFAQKDGYWDKERATSKEITLSAGKRTLIKSEDLPVGTTEFIYRITVLDENQKLSSSLVSVLKAIPDPSGISQGAAGAIHLTSTIAGSDKCTYALFSNADAANLFLKEAKLDGACLTDKEKVNKVARLVSTSSTCLSNIPYLWFGIESQNWVMNQKIVLEVVPWIDYKASRGWDKEAKQEILGLAEKTEVAKLLEFKNKFLIAFLEQITSKYKYSEFKQLLPLEKTKLIESVSDESIVSSGILTDYLKLYNTHIRTLSLLKPEAAIKELHQLIDIRKLGKENEYDLLGSLYLRTKQYQKAEDWILKAISLNKNEIKFQLHLAHVYLVTDRYSEAKEIHKKYKDQNIAVSTSWINATKQDFENMEKIGLPSDNFKKILRLLD